MSFSPQKISVVMPTYNASSFLQEALQSIADQTRPIDELIISDDESDDNTLNIVRQFSGLVDFPVQILQHKRNGPTANYLNVLRGATGDLVLFADQDDVWLAEKTEMVEAAFSDQRVSLVCHDSLLVNESLAPNDETLRGNKAKSKRISKVLNSANDVENLRCFLKGGLPLLAHSLSIRSEIISTLLKKPSKIDQWWFEEWVSCISNTFGRIHFIPNYLVLYRQHSTQTSGGFTTKAPNQLAYIAMKNKYGARIIKMEFCAQLIEKSKPLEKRYSLFAAYISFLKKRQNILDTYLLLGLIRLMKCLFIGDYHKHANGIKSAGLDAYTLLKSRGV